MEKILLKQYQEIVDKSSIVSKTDLRGIITYVNDKFCEKSGYSREELIGKAHNIVRHPDNPKELFTDLWDTIKNKKQTWKAVVKNKKKNGCTYILKTYISPIFDKNGEVLEYISIRTDITDLEKAKEKAYEAYKKIEELNKKKDEFLNIATHELRTPLTGMKGFLSMIIDGDIGKIDDIARDRLKKIYDNTDVMINLINDMLDIGKMESIDNSFEMKKINIFPLFQDIIDELSLLSKDKNIKVLKNIDYESAFIIGNEIKFKQIIRNLLSNAIKFTKQDGEINIISYKKDDNIYVGVKDNGIGIKQEDIPKVFEKFGQVKNSYTNNILGTGLGIPLVAELVKIMGGELKVNTKYGEGSEFFFNLKEEK